MFANKSWLASLSTVCVSCVQGRAVESELRLS